MNQDTNATASATVQPSTSIDDPLNLQFDDGIPEAPVEAETPTENAAPEETEVTDADTPEQETQSEQPEAADEEESAEVSAEDDDSGEAEQASDEADPVIVTLDGGEQLTLGAIKELRESGLRQADYTRKTQEVAEQRRQLEANAANINATIDAFSNYLASQMPPAPDPSLALTDKNAYIEQKAIYDAALQNVQQIIQMGQQSKSVTAEMEQSERQHLLAKENAALLEKMPRLRDEGERKKFNAQTFKTAQAFGFTTEELNGLLDHRLMHMGYYAALGLEAEKAKATAKKKTQNVPPVTPGKKRSAPKDTGAEKQKAAMNRLNQTGSIQDAMKVDFV